MDCSAKGLLIIILVLGNPWSSTDCSAKGLLIIISSVPAHEVNSVVLGRP
jgi:hypothetical protein